MPIIPSYLTPEEISMRSKGVDPSVPLLSSESSGVLVTFSPGSAEPLLVSEPTRCRHELFLSDTIRGSLATMAYLQALAHVDLHGEGMIPASENRKVRILIGSEENTDGPDGAILASEARQYAISVLVRDLTADDALEAQSIYGISDEEMAPFVNTCPSP